MISRGGRAVARLMSAELDEEREPGFVAYAVPDSFFALMSEDELRAW